MHTHRHVHIPGGCALVDSLWIKQSELEDLSHDDPITELHFSLLAVKTVCQSIIQFVQFIHYGEPQGK